MISIEENLGGPKTVTPPQVPVLSVKRVEGCLAEGSFLRECFPRGIVPLVHPIPERHVVCGQEIVGYLLDLEKLTALEFNAVARMTAQRSGTNLNAILVAMTEDKMIPMSMRHISLVVIRTRLAT